MRRKETFLLSDSNFKWKILEWVRDKEVFCFLDSNGYQESPVIDGQANEFILGVGKQRDIISSENSFQKLRTFHNETHDWLFGYLTYDLKNEIEELVSQNPDHIQMPSLYFFQPELILSYNSVELVYDYDAELISKERVHEIHNSIVSISTKQPSRIKSDVKCKVSKNEYLKNVEAIRDHIKNGDIYEMNYCIEFYTDNVTVDPLSLYKKLNKISPTPFSCFFKYQDKYLFSASPERYLKKKGNKIYSQPIKGTVKRSPDVDLDEKLKSELLNSEKEKAENVMIVDLVRNDLSITADPGSVKVEELFGIYSFKQVHQMISTVSSTLGDAFDFTDVIKTTFPMGSMTGAPKVKAMELIEKYEETKRGLYSGAVGYITPEEDFDFNVVIRSILYNAQEKYLSFMVGSAITYGSEPEKEYEECILKAQAMLLALNDE